MLKATGYQVGAGLADVVSEATYLLLMALIILPSQTVIHYWPELAGTTTLDCALALRRMSPLVLDSFWPL